jgi:hypothetical protein
MVGLRDTLTDSSAPVIYATTLSSTADAGKAKIPRDARDDSFDVIPSIARDLSFSVCDARSLSRY